MARKILTYKEIGMAEFVQPTISDPTVTDAIEYIGRQLDTNTVMYHFDPALVTPQENAEINEQRVWDLDDPVEFAEMKEFVKQVPEITRKVAEIEAGINRINTFKLFKGIIDNDAEVIAMINAIDDARGAWLASVGLVGNSIIS